MRVNLCTPQSARLLGERVRVEGETSVTKVGTGAERERVKVSPSRSRIAGREMVRVG